MFKSHARTIAALVVAGGLQVTAAAAVVQAAEPDGAYAGTGDAAFVGPGAGAHSGSAAPRAAHGRSQESLPTLTATRLEAGQSPRESLAAAAGTVANPPTYLGDGRYKCVYRDAGWWSYDWEGASASWEKAENAYNHFGAQDLRNTGWIGGTSKADYTAEIGEGRILAGGGWLRLKVKYPWRYSGDVDLLSEFSAVPIGGGFSSAEIDMSFYVDLARDDSGAKLVVDSFSLTADKGVPADFDDVRNDGFATRQVSLTGFGETVKSAFGVDAHLSTSTQSMTNARAAFDFRDDDGHGWKTGASQKWIYTLKPGWVMNDCGED